MFGIAPVAIAEPTESRQKTSYEMCIGSANSEFINCELEAGKNAIKSGGITFTATYGIPQVRATAAGAVAGATLLYETAECSGEYIARRVECKAEEEERSVRRRRVSRRRRARRNRH
ncbi:MAG: hypothetical protein AAF378_14705 [Cyanobacteria bacterium P01_A01_bin.84]